MSDGRKTYATVPYRDKPELTCSIIEQLSEQEGLDGLILLNHASSPETDAFVQEVLHVLDSTFQWKAFPPRRRSPRCGIAHGTSLWLRISTRWPF